MLDVKDISAKRSKERWIQDPREDRDIARKVLHEVALRVELQIGRDYGDGGDVISKAVRGGGKLIGGGSSSTLLVVVCLE